jgi:regulator of PEP synthase PpsR (kinase-PPPase family)
LHSIASTPVSIPEWDDSQFTDEDEEMIRLIRGPLGAATPRPRPKAIIIISDTTGVTAKSAVEKSLAQFNGCDERYIVTYLPDFETDDENEGCENLTTQIYPFVKTKDEIASIVRRVGERKDAIVVFTLSDPTLREHTSRMCALENIPHVDLLGPMYDTMSVFFNRKPFGTDGYRRSFDAMQQDKPPQRRFLSDDYYRRIEAVEFTLKCDDGMNTIQLPNADVIICGVSRTGKTPLSVVLAQTMGLKVSNVPLVVDLPPPSVLLNAQKVNPKRVFVLTLNPDDLLKIRKTRIERELGGGTHMGPKFSNYADRKYIRNDLKHAQCLAVEHGFTEIDVTGRAVEETASLIRSMLYNRFGDMP